MVQEAGTNYGPGAACFLEVLIMQGAQPCQEVLIMQGAQPC